MAAPAFAAGPNTSPSTSVNGGLTDALNNKQLDGRQIVPLVKTVKDTANTVKGGPKNLLHGNQVGPRKNSLLGGLPIGR
ncbi:hypothetical protein [Streptomyces sp. NPDC048650]|uniref:hypothetical protein n=1 Tax=unclassified Streptomyces TaxID=2593676 RepID=UPI003711D258